jgi:eukaryotic-like serine/threonine-protein kinase
MPDDSKTEPRQPDSSALNGMIAGRFLIQERLGAGGMGEVYRAEDTKLHRPVALKRIAPRHSRDPHYRSRFRKEAERASILYDQHIAGIHDVLEFEGEMLLVMEYVNGSSLRVHIGKPFEVREFLSIAIQCTRGLSAAHAKDIIHRDIKPENIMLTHNGQVKICDFGLSRQLSHSNDSTVTAPWAAHIVGTPPYMAPECLLGSIGDQRADIFSMGVVFYEMLTGTNPFANNNAAVREKVAPVSQLNSAVPSELDRLIKKMLARDPHSRYSTAQEVLEVLRHVEKASLLAPRMRRMLMLAALLCILIAGVIVLLDRSRPKSAALTERDYILISHISNSTGESVFDDTLESALVAQLSQSPFLNIASDQRIQSALRFMGKPADAVLTPSIALEVCSREALKAMLTGSLVKIGESYVFSVTATNCQTGDPLAADQVQVDKRDNVLRAVGVAASRLRSKLGESLASIQKFDAPIEKATTPSLEAFRAFTLGNAARRKGNTEEALAFFKHAVEMDPNFALAYARLSQTYYNLAQRSAGAEFAKKAFALRDRVSEREKLYIAITYYHTVSGETDKTPELYRLWQQTYPRDVLAYTGDVWITLDMGLGIHRAIESAKAAVAIDPDHVPANGWLAMSYIVGNRFKDARDFLERGISRGVEGSLAHLLLYWIGFAQNDIALVDNQSEWAGNHPSEEYSFLIQQANAAAFNGKLMQARALFHRASESARRFQLSDSAAAIAAEEAFTEAELGSEARVKNQVAVALNLSRDRDALALSAIALARAGAFQDAQSLIEEAVRRFPLDFHVRTVWVPVAEAAMALRQGKVDHAVDLLKTTLPYELGTDTLVGTAFRPIFIRGQAFLGMKAGAQAAQEFKKITDHQGVFPVSPLYPLSYLGLARAYALSGDLANSQESYRKFLTFWQNADPDLPLLKEAKLESDRLNRQQAVMK